MTAYGFRDCGSASSVVPESRHGSQRPKIVVRLGAENRFVIHGVAADGCKRWRWSAIDGFVSDGRFREVTCRLQQIIGMLVFRNDAVYFV